MSRLPRRRIVGGLIGCTALAGIGSWGASALREAGRSSALVADADSAAASVKSVDKSTDKTVANGHATVAGGPAQAGPFIEVEAVQAIAADAVDDTLAVGTLLARESVVLRPEIAGRIVKVAFRDGDRVAAGDLLVQLDDTLLAAELAQARAELALSQAHHQRTADLASRQFVSGSALDQALAALHIQQAKLQLAQARWARTRVRAPFAGVLGLRRLSPGDFVREGDDLVVLEDLSTMKVDLRLPERFVSRLRRGQAVKVSVDALPGRELPARLDAFDVQIDAQGRSLLVRGLLANAAGELRRGMFARARIEMERRPGATWVPEEAIVASGGANHVYTVVEGVPTLRPVRLGLRHGDRVEVIGAVRAGDWVVTAGQAKLAQEPVRVRLNTGRRDVDR